MSGQHDARLDPPAQPDDDAMFNDVMRNALATFRPDAKILIDKLRTLLADVKQEVRTNMTELCPHLSESWQTDEDGGTVLPEVIVALSDEFGDNRTVIKGLKDNG